MPKPTVEGRATMKCPIDPMTCKLYYLIILKLLYLRAKKRIGSYVGLQVDLYLGLGLPIRDPSPPKSHIGTCRVSVESHGPAP